MALKFSKADKSGAGSTGTYDHNLLINRGLPDQHTIESTTGLREALNKKYEKPFSGIPKSDLAFDVATLHDLDVFRNTEILTIVNDLTSIANEIYQARGDKPTLREYIDTKVSYEYWSGNGGVGSGGNGEVGYPLYETYEATEGQTQFLLTKTYRMGTHQLEVYLNGIRMVEGYDYNEINENTVEFLYELEKDDYVLFMVRAIVNYGLHEEHVAIEGQTDFTLGNPYGIYQNILQVFRNGVLQRKGRDYQEIHSRLVQFLFPLEKDDLVTFHQAGATDPIAGTIIESEIGRMKLNQAYTTMNINEAVGIAQTDYMDMFVDVFINDNNIDKERSHTYLHEGGSIKAVEASYQVDTTEEFKMGVANNIDIDTYANKLRLMNSAGGTELRNFHPHRAVFQADKVIDAWSGLTNHGLSVYATSVEKPAGHTELTIRISSSSLNSVEEKKTFTIHSTDGYFLGLRGTTDEEGKIHLVYHEQNAAIGNARVHYAVFNKDGDLITKRVISDTSFDAIAPDVAVANGVVHFVFSSKRVATDFFNVDYRTLDETGLSGFTALSYYIDTDVLNPSVAVGTDNIAKVVFELQSSSSIQKQIVYTEVKDNVIIYTEFLTDGVTPSVSADIALDAFNNAHITWRSKRLSNNYGIDYCTVANRISSGIRTIAAGTTTLIFGVPRIAVDYDNVSHIVFHANEQHSDYNNILHTFVYPDGTVTPFRNIANQVSVSLNDPDVSILGDIVRVTCNDTEHIYAVDKLIANYETNGQFTYTFDSKSRDTVWKSLQIDGVYPINTQTTVLYRLSNDTQIWTPWTPIAELATETEMGQYMQVRLSLLSSDASQSPEIHSIVALCEPLWIDVYSTIKLSSKQVTSGIVAARFDGEIEFYLSRDAGNTFVLAVPEKASTLLATPFGEEMVLKARIKRGSQLHAWGMVW